MNDQILIFSSSFLAATLIPFGSEISFLALVKEHNAAQIIILASIGNTLGAVLNYFLGTKANFNYATKYLGLKRSFQKRIKAKLDTYGNFLSFFCWLPIIGDPLSFLLGHYKYRFLPFLILCFVGKFLRYLVLFLIMTEVKVS